MEALAAEAWKEANRRIRTTERIHQYDSYVEDPASFGRKMLSENYTDGIVQVMESVRDNPVTIARSANDVGKSHGAARIAVWFYKCFHESQVYITAAPPLDNLKRILWGEVMSVFTKHPQLFDGDRMRALSIYRSPRSFIAGVAIPTSGSPEEREAKFSGKHAPHLLFIVDEGDAVPDEVYRGIEACMSGGHARLLVMFNPRGSYGPVYTKEREKQANVVKLSAFDHPNVITGENIIPGAVTRETTLRRINQWTRPLMSGERIDVETFEVPGFLVGQTAKGLDGIEYPGLPEGYRRITDPAFSYMVLGEYPSKSELQLINQTWIDAARSRWDAYVAMNGEAIPYGTQPIMGIDVAEMGADSNVVCLRYGGFVARMRTWSGMDTDLTARKSLAIYYEVNALYAAADGTGVGSNVAPSMARIGRESKVRAVSVKASEKPSNVVKSELGEFHILRDQLWWAVREWLRTDPGAMLPPDDMLIEELKTPTYFIPEDGKIHVMKKETMREMLRRSPDRADALGLTFTPYRRATVTRLITQ